MNEETRLALEADELAVRELVSELGAELVRDDSDESLYWLAVRPPSAPNETFVARIQWTRYPYAAPSVKFSDEIGGRIDLMSSWPIIPGYRPGSFDICQPFTAEGFAVHPEWVEGSEAWPITGNPFLWVVETILGDFASRFGGRAG